MLTIIIPVYNESNSIRILLKKLTKIKKIKKEIIVVDDGSSDGTSKILKEEGKINWQDTAENIIGKVNGLYPAPGAFFIFNGERYKILKAEIGNQKGDIGEVVSNYVEVVCGNKQSIKIIEIQRQGRKPQNIGEFVFGSQIKKGSIISNG